MLAASIERVLKTYLHISISHTYIIRVGLKVLGCCHDGELNCPLIAKRLISPFSYRSDLFHRCDAVVCNKHLRQDVPLTTRSIVSLSHSLSLTDVITVCPSFWVTKSFTWPDRAAFKWFPPMKWAGRLCFAEYDRACPLVAVPLV